MADEAAAYRRKWYEPCSDPGPPAALVNNLPSNPIDMGSLRRQDRTVNQTQTRKSPDARNADFWPLCRDPVRPDDAGTAGGLPLTNRDTRPTARTDQDLGAQSQIGEGCRTAWCAFPHRLFAQRARTRDRRRDHQQQMAFNLPNQRT